jgi:Ser/Thr protein kinase RdoA (MazF antagonist)
MIQIIIAQQEAIHKNNTPCIQCKPYTMKSKRSPTHLWAGIDHQSFDTRNFEPTCEDISALCHFFAIGKLQKFQKDKDIVVSHSNFFIFTTTSRGQYALKFYPKDSAKMISLEYAINRFLIDHHFPTPQMHKSQTGYPFMAVDGRLATCFSYIQGHQAWQLINQQKTICQINKTLFSLKHLLSSTRIHFPFLRQRNFLATAKGLSQTSQEISPYDKKNLIDESLKNACHSYQQHQSLFNRQYLHNNANLTNFLIDQNRVYILDLSHIREDYVLSDLASLVISCLFLDIPSTTIKSIVQDYFDQHALGSKHFPVLAVLVRIELIKEYLKNIYREKSINLNNSPQKIKHSYLFHLSTRKGVIAAALKNITDNQTFII